MLGVATLIVVTSVMNGFHRELMDKIMGINGHAFLQAVETSFTDWDDVGQKNCDSSWCKTRYSNG